jgi:glucose-6-phosphate isomerase
MTATSADLERAVRARLVEFERDRVLPRMWDGDVTVWADDPATPEIKDRLGWLTVGSLMAGKLQGLLEFSQRVHGSFDRLVLLGMGGSSLAPEVLWRSFGRQREHAAFHMLDSTHPAAVRSVLDEGEIGSTLFVVASKSGTTIETDALFRFFWEQAGKRGDQFVAITDPGTVLDRRARESGFRGVFHGAPDIGGRFSALTHFGLVPAALVGIDVAALLDGAETMANRCAADVSVADNPGVQLGIAMAEAALMGRDKLTLLFPPELAPLGLWIEQLVAESTGKGGRGILPVPCEPVDARIPYRDDRLYVVTRFARSRTPALDARVRDIEAKREPIVKLTLDDPAAIGAEFFRWELATAVAGAILGVNPFDQPNVAESKARTTDLLASGVTVGAPPPLRRHAVAEFLGGVRPGDYVAVQAYTAPSEEQDQRLMKVCGAVRDRLEAVVTASYGPRYLHSTGQLHKGGPATGHFIQLFAAPSEDLPIPGLEFGFAQLIGAQAEGDALALSERGRSVLRVADAEQLLTLL